MRTSNKILLTVGAGTVLFVFLLSVAVKFMPEKMKSIIESHGESSIRETRTVSLGAFNEILVKGYWEISLVQGDTYRVEIDAPKDDIEKILVEKKGSTLLLDSKTKSQDSDSSGRQKVSISLPLISQIDLSGITKLKFSGFSNEALSVNFDGVTSISGTDSKIQNLSIIGKGIFSADLSDTPVTNAMIQCEGTYTMDLLMNGGRLSGNLKGVGKLSYQGNVSVNEIQVENPESKVVKR